MSVVVVGGHSRNVGKTSVAAALIAALPHYNWTAMKITQFGHGVCSAVGDPCDCAVEYDHPYALTEETAPGSTDRARFLAAGARRSFWLRTAAGQLGAAVAVIREIVESSENTIVESNSILQFWKPDLYIAALDVGVSRTSRIRRATLPRPRRLPGCFGRGRAPLGSSFPPLMGIEALLRRLRRSRGVCRSAPLKAGAIA